MTRASMRGAAGAALPAAVLSVLATAGMAQSGGTYYVSPQGDNSSSGSESNPWRTLEHAVARLGPGDVLLVRGGHYSERNIDIGVAGTSTAPITIEAYRGERPVLDGGFAEFRVAGNEDWQLVDADKAIYRSTLTYPGADQVYGYFGSANGGYRLVSYEDYGPFSTDNEVYNDQWPFYYVGPGVYWNPSDQRIYARLEHGILQAEMGFAVPSNLDPRQTPMFLFAADQILDFEPGSSNIIVKGLHLEYANNSIEVSSGAHHLVFQDCVLKGGRYHVHVRDGTHHVTFDGVLIQDSIPPWVARTDVKRPSSGRPAHLFQGAGIGLEGSPDSVLIQNCTISDVFDAIYAPEGPTNLSILSNTFERIRDDVVQCGTGAWNVEFGYNRAVHVHSGFSRNGSIPPPLGREGTKFIHHNVFDTSVPHRIGRPDPLGLLHSRYQGPLGDGMGVGTVFGRHNTDSGIEDPWKIYHNTIVAMDDTSNKGIGFSYSASFGRLTRGVPHEVYNNIFVQVSDKYIGRGARVGDLQVYDGNVYHRSSEEVTRPLLYDMTFGTSERHFDDLADFLASPVFDATRQEYSPGWEGSGDEADPILSASYIPAVDGPAARGAVNLLDKNWPGIEGETFRGAIEPTGHEPPSAVAVDDVVDTRVGISVTIEVLANDFPAAGQALEVIAIGQPVSGIVEMNSEGSLRYTPDDGFAGNDCFEYHIADGNGGSDQAEVRVRVKAASNQAPILVELPSN